MRITFLGTGTSQGVPVIACQCEVCSSIDFRDQRLRTSIHIHANNKSFVIDAGPDFRQQMLRERIMSLDAIIFTHEHKDHTAGLDDVRAYNFLQRKDMPIYATQKVIKQLKMEYNYIFDEANKYPGIPQIEINELKGLKPFIINEVKFTPIEVLHYKLPVLGYRIGDFTYITDANFVTDEEKEKIRGSKILVVNALQKETHISHFNLDQAIAFAQDVNAEHTYFTHISHKMGLHADVEKELPENISIAYDGLTIEL